MLLKIDFTLKDELRGPAEADVPKRVPNGLKTYFELLSALDLHLDRRRKLVHARAHQRRSGHARPAGQRFTFYAALKGADPNVAGPEHLDEIDVRTPRSEVRVAADFRPELLDHRFIGIGNKENRMWNTGVDGVDRLPPRRELKSLLGIQVFRLGQDSLSPTGP